MMYCNKCGEELEEEWEYCPYCGEMAQKRGDILERFPNFSQFGSLFNDIDKEFRRIEEEFGPKVDEELRLPDEAFKKPYKGGGVSIRITTETGKEPKIDVKTFGDYKEHEPELLKRFGIEEMPAKKERPLPKVTKEPKTDIKRVGDKIIARIKLPGVKSDDDVEIQRMEESVEVRAYARGNAYFTLFSVPLGYKILSKKLDNEELVLELDE